MSAVPREVLSSEEMLDLDRCEKVIATGLATFMDVGSALLTIRDGRLYRATCPTFEEYCHTRWQMPRQHAYRLIDACQIGQDLSPMGDTPAPANERQVRPLKSVPPADRPRVWKEAVEATGGKPTAKAVQQAAAKLSRVNGEEAPDPKHVARLRKAGAIPADAVVTIEETGPAGDAEDVDERAAIEDDQADEQWVQALPLWSKLQGYQRKQFARDAITYRRLEPARRTYRDAFRRIVKATAREFPGVPSGHYEDRTSLWLRMDAPDRWIACPTTQHGGCGGTGQVQLVGECPKCKGRGYKATVYV